MAYAELADVAAAIADGAAIDWNEVAVSPELAPAARILERIAQVHASYPPASSFTSSIHKSLSALQAAARAESTLTSWGPLTIGGRIGGGTFGDVFRAHDPRLERDVALKLLRMRDQGDSILIDEAHLMARVRHPNVVTVYGAERIDGRIGIWMEFIDGRTLEQELRERGPLPSAEVARIGADLARALAAVHRAGLLHRDLKAQNVMRDRDGRVLLTDFGAGRRSDEQPAGGSPELAGTPLYLAPEVVAGEPASRASDIYSLGVVLYHLVTGAFPVTGRSIADIADAHKRNANTPLRTARPEIPRRFAAAVERALARDARERYADAAAFEAAIVASCSRRRAGVLAAAAIAAAVAAGGTGMYLHQQQAVASTVTDALAFKPRDSVLVTRFENATGESALDGGVEYPIRRELADSDVINVVSFERIYDALRLMKRPLSTIVDRAVGREICLRDGGIRALIGGRIEKGAAGYVLTASIVGPSDDSIVSTITERVSRHEDLVPAAARLGARLREALGDVRRRIKRVDGVHQASTASLRAFQLFNSALELDARGHTQEAERAVREALELDPTFAAAWIELACVLQDRSRPSGEVLEAAERARALSASLPEAERLWVEGNYQTFAQNFAAAVTAFEELVRLRPDSPDAAAKLQSAYLALGRPDAGIEARKGTADQRPLSLGVNYDAASLLVQRGRIDEAAPFIARIDALLAGDHSDESENEHRRTLLVADWRAGFDAYIAWNREDYAAFNAEVDRLAAAAVARSDDERWRTAIFAGNFYMSLGRLRDAEKLLRGAGDGAAINLGVLYEVWEKPDAFRRQLLEVLQSGRPFFRVERLVRAGLIDRARTEAARPPVRPLWEAQKAIGRGELALLDGDPERAISLFRQGLAVSKGAFSSEIQNGCESLATALVQVGRRDEAIRELEACSAIPARYVGMLNSAYQMRLDLRLADEYRAVGRVADAVRIENHVRRQLAFADADHPLLVRLTMRRTGG